MDISAIREEIRLKLTGGVLNLELDDKAIDTIINSAFREIQRYIDTTRFATLPFKSCIDLSDCKVSSVSRVFRAKGYLTSGSGEQDGSLVDPMYAAQWQMLSGANGYYNSSDWTYNYGAWNTMLQVRNTASTDLLFIYDKDTSKLYVNVAFDKPDYITIEYVPRYDDASQITSDFWIDILIRLAVGLTKVTVGRIRSRYTQTNALWAQDGEKLVDEGNTELTELRQFLVDNSQLVYPID